MVWGVEKANRSGWSIVIAMIPFVVTLANRFAGRRPVQPRQAEWHVYQPLELDSSAAPVITNPYFLEKHDNDRVDKLAALPVIIIVDGVGFGTLEPSSAFRWSPMIITMYPTFVISVRENHLVGDELDAHRRINKCLGIRGYTKDGREKNSFREDYAEMAFEFDHDHIEEFEMRRCTADDLSMLQRH